MSKKKDSSVEENKMVTVYATKGNISINGKFIKKWDEAKITEDDAKKIKASRLNKMVDFK